MGRGHIVWFDHRCYCLTGRAGMPVSGSFLLGRLLPWALRLLSAPRAQDSCALDSRIPMTCGPRLAVFMIGPTSICASDRLFFIQSQSMTCWV